MTELKLKLPIKVLNHEAPEGETTSGFTIIDANESEFYFYENKETGEVEYDGCCVEPQQIEVITQHLQSETTEYSRYLTFAEAIEKLEEGKKLKNLDSLSKYEFLQMIETKTSGIKNVVEQRFVAAFFKNGGYLPHPYSFDILDILSDNWVEIN